MRDSGLRTSPPGDGYPSRRVSIGLTRGGEMHVSLPGKPNEPIDERTLEALRAIGEATLNRMASDEDYAPGPREDWYCRCREVAPDRIGTVPVLRPARLARCSVCFTDAPWSALRGE